METETATKIGGNVVGKHFTLPNYPGNNFYYLWCFEEFPWGSSLHNIQMILSMSSTPYVYSYDGREQWVEMIAIRHIHRLAKGHDAKELKPYVNKMREDHFPLKEMKNMGLELNYDFTVLSDVYTQDPYIKKMGWIMSIVAFVLLFTSVMNYLLIIVGNLVSRSREMAVRKCYGAKPKNIHAIIFSEALVHVGLAVVLAALLVFLCKGTIENFLSAPISTLVLNRGSWILVVICLLVLLIGGFVPGWLYNKIPVAIAFRGYNENRNRWKLALLGIQFVISGLLFSLLYIVNGQYQLMLGLDLGYDYDNVAIVSIDASDANQRQQCMAEIRRMPNVKDCCSTYSVPINGYNSSGNMVGIPGDDNNTINIMEMSGVDDNYFKMMNIPIVQGSFFTDRSDSCRQVIIDERCAEKLIKTWHWKDGVVGKQITCTGHDENVFTVCGVCKNVRWGDVRTCGDMMNGFPLLYFYSLKRSFYILVKFNELKEESLSELQTKVQSLYPNNKVIVKSYASELANQYASQLNFRNGILVAGIVTMIIALFGLVGYTSDEVNRRRKEIAIRKVNGAKVKDILRIFLKNIMKIALPCIIVGDIGAWLIARQWLMSFSEKITLTPLLFICVTILLLVIIALSVIINCYKVANSNPVKYLKDE